jgi:hypothetical protein
MATVVPFSKFSTINTTQVINANRSTVWPVVKAMDQWDTFQDFFDVTFKGGNGIPEVGQQLFITSAFPVIDQTTLEEYDEIIEEERICWTLRGFQLLGLASPALPSPPRVLRTARCIELFDNGPNGTMIHNWISYAGVAWPLVCLFTGLITKNLFSDFNAELAAQF